MYAYHMCIKVTEHDKTFKVKTEKVSLITYFDTIKLMLSIITVLIFNCFIYRNHEKVSSNGRGMYMKNKHA